MTQYLARLVDGIAAPSEREGTILDMGCGDGRGSLLLIKELESRGRRMRLIGVDNSAAAVQWAQAKTPPAQKDRVCFRVGDMTAGTALLLPHERPTVVIMREVIEHLPPAPLAATLAGLRELEGLPFLVVTTPSINSPVERKHYQHFSEAALRALIEEAGFEILHLGGFGFRPRALYGWLIWLKARLDRSYLFWSLLNICWRPVRPRWAITLFCVARPRV